MSGRVSRFSSEVAASVERAGCVGMRAAPVAGGATWDSTALYFAAGASSDDHAAPYDQWLVVTRGAGWTSVDEETLRVSAGDAIVLPKNSFHRVWTGDEPMDALALAFQVERGPDLVRVADRPALARLAAQRFVLAARAAISARGRFAVALSGGSTPRELYALLAEPEFATQIDRTRVHFFWGDERAVPPDDPESNYRMTREALLARIDVPEDNVHRFMTERGPDEAAREYETSLSVFFGPGELSGASVSSTGFPQFDLVLLGLGANGHTASLFPHTQVLNETVRWVAAEHVAEVDMWRLTLTAPVINAARDILFLVAGADKAQTVYNVLRGERRPQDLPAQLIQPATGDLTWLLDREAAGMLGAERHGSTTPNRLKPIGRK